MEAPTIARRGGIVRQLFAGWTWRMAWRDSRTSRRKLALFSCSIVLGVAALAAIGSLGRNLEQAIETQSKALLGADLVINSRDPFTPEQEQWLQSLGGEQSREIAFTSMVLFPRTGGTRLVQVRALEGRFPFYGKLETDPPDAADQFRRGKGAVVEDTVLRQFEANVGDEVRVGRWTTRIVGRLLKVPGETVALSTVAPRVYLAMADLPQTGLLQPDVSLARYRVYYEFAAGTNLDALVTGIRPQLEKFRFGHDTVEERKRELGRSMENLYHFLGLVGFVALLLGGVGVAGAIHVHVRQKLGSVAILRCLGGTVSQVFAVYLAQGMALGMFGAGLGGGLGILIQSTLPKVLADFIPFTFEFHTAWAAVARAVGMGFLICLLFALLPLLAVRKVSPLAAVRVSFEHARRKFDPWRAAVMGCLAAGVLGFACSQTQNWRIGLGFAVALGLVFAVLAAVARLLVACTRRCVPAGLPYTVRQGLANLHRPNNRTLSLLLSVGLGTCLMLGLFLVQQNLLTQLIPTQGHDRPNAVIFDIQNSQKDAVAQLVKSLHLPVLDDTPIVAMRLGAVQGRPVESILAETNQPRGRRWVYRREYRSTYRDHLSDGERIVAGQWMGRVLADAATGEYRWESTTNPGERFAGSAKEVPVSLEEGIAKDLHVGLGDVLVFDIQGVPMPVRVASLRQVEWRRIQPNFFVVFPAGVLESAPAMHVLLTHVNSNEESARLQRDVVQAFPNVSAIDLTLVLQTVDAILNKIAFVIRFLAMFTVLTGLLVMVTALLTGRYQRLRESVLLRTLGASRGQVWRILLVEYLALGLLAAMVGSVLALASAAALARFVFHTPFVPDVWALSICLVSVPAVTVLAGFAMSRGVLTHPPLAILRSET